MMTASEIIDQLRQLQAAQGDRARVYNDFKTAFKQFLNDPSSIQSYTQSCQVITQEMQEISSNVRNIENKFDQNENTRQYASLIRKLQNQEKQKQEMHESETGHLCAVHDCQLHSHEQVRGEKLAYLEMDLRKYQSHINTVINEINDLLEEIKYEIEDLTENL
jgi:predicted  nucleic acid-binding Zn-ribbon protein